MPQKQVSDKRCGSKAALQVRLHEGGIWRVTAFHKDHNHELVSSTLSKKATSLISSFHPREQNVEMRAIKDAKKIGTCAYCHRNEGHHITTCPIVLLHIEYNDVSLSYFLLSDQFTLFLYLEIGR
jgi:hypothetical protein